MLSDNRHDKMKAHTKKCSIKQRKQEKRKKETGQMEQIEKQLARW